MIILKPKTRFLLCSSLLLLLMLFPVNLSAQNFDDTDSILRLRSSSLWRGVNNLVVEDNLIYAVHKSGFAVYDPQQGFLGVDTLSMVSLEHAYENSFRLFNEYLLYNRSGRVGFVFVKDPSRPFVTAESDLQTSFLEADYRSLYLYLACGFEGVKVLYLGRRDNPVLETRLREPAHTVAVWLHGEYLYAIDDYNGLFFYDISESPEEPRFIGKRLFVDQLKDMVTVGDIAYCANTDGGLVLLDLSDPVDPQFIGRYETETVINTVEESGGYIFASDVYGNYEIYHPDSMEIVTYLDRLTMRTAPTILEDFSGKYLAAVDTGSVARVFSLGADWERRELMGIGGGDRLRDFALNDNRAYIAAGADPLIQMDTRTYGYRPAITFYPARSEHLVRHDSLLFLADNNNYQLWVSEINLSSWLSTHNLIQYDGKAVALSSDRGADGSINLALFTRDKIILHNLNQDNMQINSTAEISGLEDITTGLIQGEYLYAADGDLLTIYIIADPARPVFRGEYEWPGEIRAVQIIGDRIYTSGDFGLQINQLQGPEPWILEGSFEFDGRIEDFVLDNNHALCAAGDDGLLILDTDSGNGIELAESYESPGYARAIDISDSSLFICDGYGFLIYDISYSGEFPSPDPDPVPRRFELSHNYPNPFNQSTLIAVDIPSAADQTRIEIDIFNILGQRVRRLVDEVAIPGRKIYRWNGRDDEGLEISSGIYFYRCRLGGIEESRKMLLLK